MTALQGIGMILGALFVLLLICVAVIRLERQFPSKKYDERQRLARGNAYRVSFTVGLVYYLAVCAYLIWQVDKSDVKVEPYLLIFLGLLVQTMVFHIYCLLTHAALPLGEKPWVAVVSYTVCGGLQLLTDDFAAPLTAVGYGSYSLARLAVGVCFLALALMHGINLVFRDKE